ncbi:hypothetical protein BT63DRAFT_287310 [Microthyrium microscopicum]|uniref:Uncharacterized protein n=1 Tax=Microthyrium microscopicum TaxID=703497 RepID=A0A6A6UB73_9PEZI|nr:hypothetical protein BT63DRAFT_287310 [Microthyrium microscopicum]
MSIFAYTPQGLLISRFIDERARKSFDSAYLARCIFEEGDRVCGTYVVSQRAARRVELALSPPSSYAGPVVKGVMVVRIEQEKGCDMLLCNEVWMWRREDEARVPIEGGMGRWMHGFFVRWLMYRALGHISMAKS